MNCEVNDTEKKIDLSYRVVLFIFSLPTFFIGSILNGVALYSICSKIKVERKKPIIYMANLIISDVFLLFSLPFKIYAYHVGSKWSDNLNMKFCHFMESLCFVNTYVSILLITLICVDRYLAIKHPFVSRAISSPKKTALTCAVVWIVVWAGSIHIQFTSNSAFCFHHLSPAVLKMEFIAPLEILFLICVLIMVFCSVQIVHSLKVRANETQNKWMDKSAKIILSNLLTFLVCFTPHHTGLLLYSLATNGFLSESYCEPLRSALHVYLCLANVNCCLDAIYYYYGIKELCQSNSRSRQIPDLNARMLGASETIMDSSVDHPLNSQSH
ncbi:G-protein coupled receptor 55-like [Heptranchias perlo]|uniref:G-protein coupled receptor 55-like n=1 Tax=Heptranchias perlo TaxID=212740 RepID=UPI00355A4651